MKNVNSTYPPSGSNEEIPTFVLSVPTPTDDPNKATLQPQLVPVATAVAASVAQPSAPVEKGESPSTHNNMRIDCCGCPLPRRILWLLGGIIAGIIVAGATAAAVGGGSGASASVSPVDSGSVPSSGSTSIDPLNNDTSVVLVGNEAVSEFPIAIPYTAVQAPTTLPFQVHGSFRADRDSPGYSGIVGHMANCDVHATCEGFKIYLSPEGQLRIIVSQTTSFYNAAKSNQLDLNDGNWHTFVCFVSAESIQVQVDGIGGALLATTDERGVQNPKVFGRVVHAGAYIIGDDPGQWDYRRFKGEIRDLAIVQD